MEYALTIKHPVKFVNVYIQDDQTLITDKIAPPVFRYDEEKAPHVKKGTSSKEFLLGVHCIENTAVDAGTASFAVVVNERHASGMAKATAETAPQNG